MWFMLLSACTPPETIFSSSEIALPSGFELHLSELKVPDYLQRYVSNTNTLSGKEAASANADLFRFTQ